MSYADVAGHHSMVFDETRNRAYAAAIERVVTPDSVVLDLGCGLGIHGLVAARAGARKVYFVDPEVVVHSALEVAQRNGLGDRVQAFQGRIEDIELPEKVDVIVSVFTGNMLYMEDLLPSLFRARDRWLKPGGVLIPDAAQLVVAPAEAIGFHDEWIGAWSRPHLGFDFSHLRRFAANRFLAGSREHSSAWPLLAPPEVLAEADLRTASDTVLDHHVAFGIDRAGSCSGVLGWIRLHLGDAWVGTGPQDPPCTGRPSSCPWTHRGRSRPVIGSTSRCADRPGATGRGRLATAPEASGIPPFSARPCAPATCARWRWTTGPGATSRARSWRMRLRSWMAAARAPTSRPCCVSAIRAASPMPARPSPSSMRSPAAMGAERAGRARHGAWFRRAA